MSIPHLLATKCVFKAVLTRPKLVAELSLHGQSKEGEVEGFLRDIGANKTVSNLLGAASLSALLRDPQVSETRAELLAPAVSKDYLRTRP